MKNEAETKTGKVLSTVETTLRIVDMFNTAAPGIATLILLIRRNDGTVLVAALLDEADAQFDKNITSAKDWLAKKKQPV